MTGGTLPCEPMRQVTRWPVHAQGTRAPAQMDLHPDGPWESWGWGERSAADTWGTGSAKRRGARRRTAGEPTRNGGRGTDHWPQRTGRRGRAGYGGSDTQRPCPAGLGGQWAPIEMPGKSMGSRGRKPRVGLRSHQVALQPLLVRRLPRENESSEQVGRPRTFNLGLCQSLLPQALLDPTLLPHWLPPTPRCRSGCPPNLLTHPSKVPPRQIPAICSLHSPSPHHTSQSSWGCCSHLLLTLGPLTRPACQLSQGSPSSQPSPWAPMHHQLAWHSFQHPQQSQFCVLSPAALRPQVLGASPGRGRRRTAGSHHPPGR